MAGFTTPDFQARPARKEFVPIELEHLFRRCSPEEALATVAAQKLADGKILIEDGIIKRRSDSDKWVTESARYAYHYRPDGLDPSKNGKVLSMQVKPGTLKQLKEQKGKTVKEGPRGAYGLPPKTAEWFNGQIVSISVYDALQARPRLLPLKQGFDILVDTHGNPCYFIAFPCSLLNFDNDIVRFGDDINLTRMTWFKTSLMWTAWHSELATKDGMDRLLQLSLPVSYLDYLVDSAISFKENTKTDEIVYQKDPDRFTIHSKKHYGLFWFSKAGSTVHFGLKGNALLDLVVDLSMGRITDITNQLQDTFFRYEFSGEKFSSALYNRLGLVKTTYEGKKRNADHGA